MIIIEEWKFVENSSGKYISDKGNVKNEQGRYIKMKIDPEGYYRCSFGGTIGTERIHRIVAKYFVSNDNPDVKIQVNHIDGDKSNNNKNNLEWVTPQQNTLHAGAMGKLSNGGGKKPIIGMNKNKNEIKIFMTQLDASKYIGSDECGSEVNKSLHYGRIAHGWLFRYLTQYNVNELIQDLLDIKEKFFD